MFKENFNNNAISIAILCGGKSTRFGDDCKILHKINGQFMFQIIYEKFKSVTDDIFLQLSQDIKDLFQQNIVDFTLEQNPVYLDRIENKGPLAGIYSALTHAKHPKVFVVAADLPCVDPRILAELKKERGYQIIIPRWSNGFYEPLCAIYSQDLLGVIEHQITTNKLSIHQLYEMKDVLKIKFVNIDEFIEQKKIDQDCFRNVNTIKDL